MKKNFSPTLQHRYVETTQYFMPFSDEDAFSKSLAKGKTCKPRATAVSPSWWANPR